MQNHPFRDWMGLDGRNNPFLTGKHLDGNSARIKITRHESGHELAKVAPAPGKGLARGLPGLQGGAAKQDYLPVSPLLRLSPVLHKQAEYLTRCAMCCVLYDCDSFTFYLWPCLILLSHQPTPYTHPPECSIESSSADGHMVTYSSKRTKSKT